MRYIKQDMRGPTIKEVLVVLSLKVGAALGGFTISTFSLVVRLAKVLAKLHGV